ncbi:hypothetical protein KCU77_g9793, partial [Aureobasidium melanogenum]
MAAFPPGGTFFDTVKRSFTDVPVEDGKIATTQFLEAAESLTTLFDVLGSTAFKPVKSDMTGNIKVLFMPMTRVHSGSSATENP